MPKRDGQKKRILVLRRILEQKTDEEHLLSVPAILKELEREGIPAERKSLYGDIEALNEAGMDVEMRRGRTGGYYLASRAFELPELKLLVDAVQAGRFITSKKSRSLITKLEGLTSEQQAKQLQRQVVQSGLGKNESEDIYYVVDALHTAIAQNKAVTFQYLEWTLRKKKEPRRGGDLYHVSPWALVWDNSYYYLVGYENGEIRHYRVDKMKGVTITEEFRQGRTEFEALDMAGYTRSTFGMFGGDTERVTLCCDNRFIGVMLDRFGTEVIVVPRDDGKFHITVPVAVSAQFFGWACGFGPGVTILRPESVRLQMQQWLEDLHRAYTEE